MNCDFEVCAFHKMSDGENMPDSAMLIRQLSTNSQQLLMKAFDELDKKETGRITRAEAVKFYEAFCNSETLSMTAAVLKATAELMVKNFAEKADAKDEISFEDWVDFFHQLEVSDEQLEEIMGEIK